MRISHFTPVYFSMNDIDYNAIQNGTHIFSTTDHILLETFHLLNEPMPALLLINAETGVEISTLTWNSIGINATERLSFYELRDLLPGYYKIMFGDCISNLIYVTDNNAELDNTVRIQYAMKDNKCRRDFMSWINGRCVYADFRIHGGFLDSDWSFYVENEQFVTASQDIVELYALDYTEKVLTIGLSAGTSAWNGEMVNRILSCDYVFIDGIRYSRSGNSTPVIKDSDINGTRFVYTQNLREAHFLNAESERANRLYLRRTPSKFRRTNNHLRKL